MANDFRLVLVREVHISHRVVKVTPDMSEADIIRAGLASAEKFCEYSHTMERENHTVEEVSDESVASHPDTYKD